MGKYCRARMKTIDQNTLVEKLRGIAGAAPLTLSALIDARARKTNNPYPEILKLSKVNGMTGFDYEKSVNRQLEREEKATDFEAQERAWGERISPALVKKGNAFYLVLKVERAFKPTFLVRQNNFLVAIAKEKIKEFLPAHKKAVSQGTEKEVVYRNYSLANIKYIAFEGEQYRVRG